MVPSIIAKIRSGRRIVGAEMRLAPSNTAALRILVNTIGADADACREAER